MAGSTDLSEDARTAESRTLRTRRAFQLAVLTAATAAMVYTSSALGPLQETMRLSLGFTDNQMALLQGPAMGVPMALGSVPAGLIVDRYSRARLLSVIIALAMIASTVTAMATNIVVMIVGRAIVGFVLAVVFVASYSMVADLYAPTQRGRATMVVSLGENAGAPAAFACGGFLLSIAQGGSTAWRHTLLWMTAALGPILLLSLMLREPSRTGVVARNPPLRAVWPQLWKYRMLIGPLLLARVMVWIGDGAVQIWAGPSFARKFGLSPDRVGVLIATALLVSATAGPVLGGPLADLAQWKGGPRRTMLTLSIVAAISAPACLFALMPSPVLATVLLAMLLTLGYAIGTAAVSLGTIVIPGELRGLYIAITIAVSSIISVAAAPLTISLLSTALGGTTMIGAAMAIVCAVTNVLGAIVFAAGASFYPTRRAVSHGHP